MKQFISVAVLALISGSQSRKLVQNQAVQLNFVDGMDDNEVSMEHADIGHSFDEEANRGVRFFQSNT